MKEGEGEGRVRRGWDAGWGPGVNACLRGLHSIRPTAAARIACLAIGVWALKQTLPLVCWPPLQWAPTA